MLRLLFGLVMCCFAWCFGLLVVLGVTLCLFVLLNWLFVIVLLCSWWFYWIAFDLLAILADAFGLIVNCCFCFWLLGVWIRCVWRICLFVLLFCMFVDCCFISIVGIAFGWFDCLCLFVLYCFILRCCLVLRDWWIVVNSVAVPFAFISWILGLI